MIKIFNLDQYINPTKFKLNKQAALIKEHHPKKPTMNISDLPLPEFFKEYYHKFPTLTPIQDKAIKANLLEKKSLLICAPTASGKTLVGTMAITNTLEKGKSLYLVPLKALATEKFREFKDLFEPQGFKVTIATGDIDSESAHLAKYDIIVLTTEKLDSILRHQTPWIDQIKTVIVDEIHLLNDPSRGPTLEIILTLLKALIQPQIISLSATIGNPAELAAWLQATLVQDSWRPVKLHQGIATPNDVEFYE